MDRRLLLQNADLIAETRNRLSFRRYAGLDTGIALLSTENLRIGNICKWFMANPEISSCRCRGRAQIPIGPSSRLRQRLAKLSGKIA